MEKQQLRAEFERRWNGNPLNSMGTLARNEDGDYIRAFTHACWSEFKAGATFASGVLGTFNEQPKEPR
jgi:hypothetical protein